jgi:poly(3-hydroxyalkanoate) synthetase
MYDPAAHRTPNLAFFWPALAAASASEFAAAAAKHFMDLAIGADRPLENEPVWATPHKIALELATLRLRDFTTDPKAAPVLLCAPFALHSAKLCDLAPGHSLVEALRHAGLRRLFVTDWRSATADMRFLGVDDYLAELNVAIDAIGAPVDLIGLCQGGWMALIYAARFPEKIRKLVLVAAPIDIAAGPSAISTLATAASLTTFQEIVRLGNGLVPGRKVLKFWGPEAVETENIHRLLQTEESTGSAALQELERAFRDWHAWTLDLPGRLFLETVERLYGNNELAQNRLTVLGRKIDLASVTVPIFLLAARDDELVAPQQTTAVERLVGTAPSRIRKTIAPCTHVGLFMGKSILRNAWPPIARWLIEETDDAVPALHRYAGLDRDQTAQQVLS